MKLYNKARREYALSGTAHWSDGPSVHIAVTSRKTNTFCLTSGVSTHGDWSTTRRRIFVDTGVADFMISSELRQVRKILRALIGKPNITSVTVYLKRQTLGWALTAQRDEDRQELELLSAVPGDTVKNIVHSILRWGDLLTFLPLTAAKKSLVNLTERLGNTAQRVFVDWSCQPSCLDGNHSAACVEDAEDVARYAVNAELEVRNPAFA